jgi:hypothetical protein
MRIFLDKQFNFLKPFDEPVIRIGNTGDGGYVVPIQALTASGLISLGLGTNWTFEQHWAIVCPENFIHAYDKTLNVGSLDSNQREIYDKFFIGRVTHFNEHATIDNIKDILSKGFGLVFLKMDIEGAEYSLFPVIKDATNLIGMSIEFHALDIRRKDFESIIKHLNRRYRIVHLHANNYGGIGQDNLPHTLEITFLHRQLCKSNNKRNDVYLLKYDSPNSSNEEYELYFRG